MMKSTKIQRQKRALALREKNIEAYLDAIENHAAVYDQNGVELTECEILEKLRCARADAYHLREKIRYGE